MQKKAVLLTTQSYKLIVKLLLLSVKFFPIMLNLDLKFMFIR